MNEKAEVLEEDSRENEYYLPVELLALVFTYLPSIHEVHEKSKVCKAFKEAAHQPIVWNRFLEKDFNLHPHVIKEDPRALYYKKRMDFSEHIKQNAKKSFLKSFYSNLKLV